MHPTSSGTAMCKIIYTRNNITLFMFDTDVSVFIYIKTFTFYISVTFCR